MYQESITKGLTTLDRIIVIDSYEVPNKMSGSVPKLIINQVKGGNNPSIKPRRRISQGLTKLVLAQCKDGPVTGEHQRV